MELLSSYACVIIVGAKNLLPLFHMDKSFIWLNETKQHINVFTIGYMINPGLHINKSLNYQVEKCMKTTFGELTQSFIKSTLSKKTSF